jgi:hypothetical protein
MGFGTYPALATRLTSQIDVSSGIDELVSFEALPLACCVLCDDGSHTSAHTIHIHLYEPRLQAHIAPRRGEKLPHHTIQGAGSKVIGIPLRRLRLWR